MFGITRSPVDFGGGGSAPWTPASLGSNLLQWLGESYAAAPVDGLQVIESLETEHGPNPATIETPCLTVSGSYATHAKLFTGTTSKLTVSLWIKPVNSGVLHPYLNEGDGSGLTGYGFQGAFTSIQKLRFFIGTAGGGAYATSTNNVITFDTWQHVAAVFDGTATGDANRAKLYLNGVAISDVTYTGGIPTNLIESSDSTFYLATAFGFVYPGQISDVKIFREVAKSDAEILAIYNGTDDRTGLTQSWKCQDGPGTESDNRTLYDDSGSGNHLTVVSGSVADHWANRRPGDVRDHAFEYGGRIGTLGEFVPLVPGTALCADGEAATFLPGSIDRNPASRTNFDPFGSADATGLGWESARAQGAERLTIDPDNTKFINVDTGRNAFAVAEPLTGLDLENALIFTTTGGEIGLLQYNNKTIVYDDLIMRYEE